MLSEAAIGLAAQVATQEERAAWVRTRGDGLPRGALPGSLPPEELGGEAIRDAAIRPIEMPPARQAR
jgi:hypothetical protein